MSPNPPSEQERAADLRDPQMTGLATPRQMADLPDQGPDANNLAARRNPQSPLPVAPQTTRR